MVLQYLRRYDDALAAVRKALTIKPDLTIAQARFQYIYIDKGMRDEQLADQKLRVARIPERLAAFNRGFAEGGYESAQRAIAAVVAAGYEKGRPNDKASGVALRYRAAGDKDLAIDWLYKAYGDRAPGLTSTSEALTSTISCEAINASRPSCAASACRSSHSERLSAAQP